ncbi:hypothetical protein FHG87_021554 [Trinorchestia longiramus]|nr:hypothetical protein FHG87_021554 [Trinorchestia longiramus]
MDKTNSVATPVDVNADLVTTSDEVEECDEDLYQSAVGMNATSYPSHRVRTCLAQETQSLTYVSLQTTCLHLSTSFPPKQTPPPLHLPSTAFYPPKPTPSSSPHFPPKHLPQPTFKGHSLSSLSLYSSLVLFPSHSTYIISVSILSPMHDVTQVTINH